MITLLNIALLITACLVLAPILLFALEVALSLLPAWGSAWSFTRPAPRTAVLIPAHNEESVIADTLQRMLPTIDHATELVVIADNCTDGTARIARENGARVLERTNDQQRGKGFALAYAVEQLSNDPPDVVVIVDADCVVSDTTIGGLARRAVASGRPVQGLNLTDRTPGRDRVQVASILGNRFINFIRPLGLARIGAPCQLMGTGMALPWKLVCDGRLSSGNLVEDMQLGVDLAIEGYYPIFCPDYKVSSAVPQQAAAFVTQRTRWEHGHLTTACTQIPRLLLASVLRLRPRLLMVALDLAIPPMALLVAVWMAAWATTVLATFVGADLLPAILLSAGGGLIGLSILLGWAAHCRQVIPFSALAGLPIYLCKKLPIYFALLVRRTPAQWVRTDRTAAIDKPVL
ncbi:glycosyltransferase family 2 protein [Lignipirellula cremea]|uniref:N-glycosyltransferase n=1 Tax=Lignipirellula cremea TaxID=2528010 RepID=A0A518DMI4_9BACT|nr:glycosyltransferase family 2 protein [Lignipirellula cremea]QDU93054.1 N-glycosyltransferase [Lignipirellula cremea]